MAYCGVPNPDGIFTLNGILFDPANGSLHTLNVADFYQRGKKRGTSRIVPFSSGTGTGSVSYPRRYKPTPRVLKFGLCGNVNVQTGAHQPNYQAGARINVQYLNEQICDPTAPGIDPDGTILASVLDPDGTTRAGRVTIEDEIQITYELDAPDEKGAGDLLMICSINMTIAGGFLGTP